MSFIVVGHAYRDRAGFDALPLPVGPFSTRQEAMDWMDDQSIRSGSWDIGPLHSPSSSDASKGDVS